MGGTVKVITSLIKGSHTSFIKQLDRETLRCCWISHLLLARYLGCSRLDSNNPTGAINSDSWVFFQSEIFTPPPSIKHSGAINPTFKLQVQRQISMVSSTLFVHLQFTKDKCHRGLLITCLTSTQEVKRDCIYSYQLHRCRVQCSGPHQAGDPRWGQRCPRWREAAPCALWVGSGENSYARPWALIGGSPPLGFGWEYSGGSEQKAITQT